MDYSRFVDWWATPLTTKEKAELAQETPAPDKLHSLLSTWGTSPELRELAARFILSYPLWQQQNALLMLVNASGRRLDNLGMSYGPVHESHINLQAQGLGHDEAWAWAVFIHAGIVDAASFTP